MKKQFLLLALIPCLTFAGERSLEQAASIAQQFMSSQSIAHRAPGHAKVKCVYTQSMPTLEREAFYVFSTADKGFVMVSAETNAPEIIGYSDENVFASKDLPDHIQSWFDYYAQQMEWLAEHPTAKAFAPSQSYTPVEPLLGKIEWGQSNPYNYFCPIMKGEKNRSPAGCIATAMAQILGYHQWPKHSRGQHSLPYDRSVILDYDKDGEYDWENIYLGNYHTDNTTPKQDTAIAKLMWHLGVACDMQYSANGSGASGYEMIYRAIRHFDIDSSAQIYYLDFLHAEAFTNLIYEQLQQKQPCMITGSTVKREGHAFVGDGIDEEGKVHINWGWDGMYNGYFYVTLLDPEHHGTGGSASELAFTESVIAYVNLIPNANNKPVPTMVGGDTLWYGGKSLVVGRKDTLPVFINNFYGAGLWSVDAEVGVGIYQDEQFVRWFHHGYLNPVIEEIPSEDHSDVFPDDLPNGVYDLKACYQPRNEEQVKLIPLLFGGKIQLEVTSDQIIVNGGIDLTMSDVREDIGEHSVLLRWESKAPYFHVEIASDIRLYEDTVIDKPEFSFANDSTGVYTYSVTPLDKDKKPSVWPGKSGIVFLCKRCPITNLQCTGENLSAAISWESEAPKFRIELKKGKKTIANSFISDQSCSFTVDKGTYTFTVTPYDLSEKFNIGNSETLEIQLPFKSDDIHNLFLRRPVLKHLEGQQVIVNINDKKYTVLGNE